MTFLLFLLTWASAWAGVLTVDILDVGQGDSILLRSPAGKTVLIDAGDGKADVPVMLADLGVKSLDLVVGTHAHADHIGGMDEVLLQMPVKFYVDQGMSHTTATYSRVMKAVEDRSLAYRSAKRGQTFKLDDGIVLEILHPGDSPLRNTRSDLNSNSVVIRLSHGDVCMLFVGDAEDETERTVMQRGQSKCQVLKVAHHGSKYSSSDHWLRTVAPEIALISVGANNRYGHPAPDTLNRLERAGAVVYRTDTQGRLHLESDGKSVTVRTQKGADRPLADRRASQSGTVAPVVAPLVVPVAPDQQAVGTEVDAPVQVTKRPTERLRPSDRRAGRSGTVSRNQVAAADPAPAAGGCSASDCVAVNTADQAALESLPGIGPSKAAAIVAYRTSNGPFTSIAQLDAVPGIGPSTLAKIGPRIDLSVAE